MIKPEQITDEMVDAVENELGISGNDWNCVNPFAMIAASANLILRHIGIEADLPSAVKVEESVWIKPLTFNPTTWPNGRNPET